VLTKIDAGVNPINYLNGLIAECMDYQRNLQLLLGFNFDEDKLNTFLDNDSFWNRIYNEHLFKYSNIVVFLMICNVMIINIVYYFNLQYLFFLSSNFIWLYAISNGSHVIYYLLYHTILLFLIAYKIVARD